MSVFHRDLRKSATRGIREILGDLVLLGGLVFLAGCPGKETSNPTTTSTIEPKISVGESPLSLTFNENGPEALVTLPYKSQGGAVPTSCEVTSPSMVAITKPCSCSAGVCRVGVQPTPKVFGVGSFEFSLSGQDGISSNTEKANVKVLEVTLSISSGDKQDGMVGTTLERPIVVLVQNSNKVPVPGVEVFWSVNSLKDYKNWEESWIGRVSFCTDKTDDRGLAQCTWTLGTRIPVGTTGQAVKVSAFYKDAYKETLATSFGASVKPGPAAILSFWSQGYDGGRSSASLYYGPMSQVSKIMGGKPEKAGVALGRVWTSGNTLVVFFRDQYGNATKIDNSDITLTLVLGETKPDGAVLSPKAPTVKAINYDILSNSPKINWTQGVAEFVDISVNKAGIYTLSVTASDPNLKVSSVSGINDFGAEFTVDPGAATKLAFTTQPSRVAKGNVWSKPPAVTVLDKFDNTVISSKAEISLAISANSGTNGAVLEGESTTVSALKGVATFPGLSIDKAGKGYTLTASSGGITPPVVSSEFDVDE